jgi:hypothetical protein
MSASEAKYKKLRGRGASFLGVTQLWMAEDHLMAVTSVMGFEQYRRFFFQNIEALVMRRTAARLAWNVVLFLVMVLIAGCGYAISETFATRDSKTTTGIVTACLIAPFLIAAAINSFLGPTCSFWVQTSGGLEPLGAPARLRAARKVVDRIAPEIARAQMAEPPQTT